MSTWEENSPWALVLVRFERTSSSHWRTVSDRKESPSYNTADGIGSRTVRVTFSYVGTNNAQDWFPTYISVPNGTETRNRLKDNGGVYARAINYDRAM